MLYIVKIFFNYKLLRKTFWCFQNFLTMEFYRKICNNCYWSNIYDPKHSIIKQSLILFVSFISVLFFSFFYLPTDPANLNKSSFILKLKYYFSIFRINIKNSFQNVSNKIILLSSSFIDILQFKFAQKDILVLKSSLQI